MNPYGPLTSLFQANRKSRRQRMMEEQERLERGDNAVVEEALDVDYLRELREMKPVKWQIKLQSPQVPRIILSYFVSII